MAKGGNTLIETQCPCCQATLKIDPGTRAVISFTEAPKPRTLEDLADGLTRLKGEAARREEAFRKSVEAEKKSKDVLARKFDELFKQAQEHPDERPPVRDIDLD